MKLSEAALHRGSHTELFMCPNRGAVYGSTAAWGSGGKGYITVFCMTELKHGDMQKSKEREEMEIKATELYRFA